MIESFISRRYVTSNSDLLDLLCYYKFYINGISFDDPLFHSFQRMLLFGGLISYLTRRLGSFLQSFTSTPLLFTRFPSSSQILMWFPASTPAGTALQNTKEESPPDNNSDILLRVSPLLLGAEPNSDTSSTYIGG